MPRYIVELWMDKDNLEYNDEGQEECDQYMKEISENNKKIHFKVKKINSSIDGSEKDAHED